jgi:hypothetical protein
MATQNIRNLKKERTFCINRLEEHMSVICGREFVTVSGATSPENQD